MNWSGHGWPCPKPFCPPSPLPIAQEHDRRRGDTPVLSVHCSPGAPELAWERGLIEEFVIDRAGDTDLESRHTRHQLASSAARCVALCLRAAVAVKNERHGGR